MADKIRERIKELQKEEKESKKELEKEIYNKKLGWYNKLATYFTDVDEEIAQTMFESSNKKYAMSLRYNYHYPARLARISVTKGFDGKPSIIKLIKKKYGKILVNLKVSCLIKCNEEVYISVTWTGLKNE